MPQAAVVGVHHPVMHMMGALPDKAMQLQSTCPPGCIHVSRRVVDVSGRAKRFVPGAEPGAAADHPESTTFLHRSGPWAAHQRGMAQRFERCVPALATPPSPPLCGVTAAAPVGMWRAPAVACCLLRSRSMPSSFASCLPSQVHGGAPVRARGHGRLPPAAGAARRADPAPG